jgi:hypothetical protein
MRRSLLSVGVEKGRSRVNLRSKNERLTGSQIHEKLEIELDDCLEVET